MLVQARRGRWIGIFLRIAIIAGLYYGYVYLQMPEHVELKQRILKEIRLKLTEFIAPLVQDMMGSMITNMQGSGAVLQNSTNRIKVVQPEMTPEMIQAIQNSMNQPVTEPPISIPDP
jgi:hypothetical protein